MTLHQLIKIEEASCSGEVTFNKYSIFASRHILFSFIIHSFHASFFSCNYIIFQIFVSDEFSSPSHPLQTQKHNYVKSMGLQNSFIIEFIALLFLLFCFLFLMLINEKHNISLFKARLSSGIYVFSCISWFLYLIFIIYFDF